MAHRIALRARDGKHYAYSGRSILVTNLDGWCADGGPEGFFHDNTRFLRRDQVRLDGLEPRPAGVSPVGSSEFLAYYEALPSPAIPARSLYLTVRRRIGDGLRTELDVTNYGREPISARLTWALDADFADSDETETGVRRQDAPVETAWSASRRELRVRYCHPSLSLASLLTVEEAPESLCFSNGALVVQIDLAARHTTRVAWVLAPMIDGLIVVAPASVAPGPAEGLHRTRADIESELPVLTASNHVVQRAWDTATQDLAGLPLGLEGASAVPAAGLPLYQQFFGRDALTISWQALLVSRRLMHDSLVACADWQGTRIDDFLDEEPGKMIHQARWGPLSKLGLDAFARYYGDWATPVDFLVMLGQYLMWTNDLETVRSLVPAARRVLEWIDRYADSDRDGFLEYRTRSTHGVKHQGWKDSDDAIVDARGKTYEPPVATCEIQGYWYAGLQQVAQVFLAGGDAAFAAELLMRARRLKKRFDRAFWMRDAGFHAMALAPGGGVVDSISSNPGHLLATGIVSRSRARSVARRLMLPDMFSGWGVRTLSDQNPFFNPFSYHRGSVWPVEQGTIAFGLARYGLWDELHKLARGVFDLTDLFAEGRLPEVVSGLPRDAAHRHPGFYPYSCEPQGWSASAIVLLVQSLLGLRAIAPLRLLVVDPHLPAWLPDLRIEGLRVGDAAVDLDFRRLTGGRTDFRVMARRGNLRVIRQPVPDGGAGPMQRLREFAGSVVRS